MRTTFDRRIKATFHPGRRIVVPFVRFQFAVDKFGECVHDVRTDFDVEVFRQELASIRAVLTPISVVTNQLAL